MSRYGAEGTIIQDSSGQQAGINSDGQLHVVMEGKVDVNFSTEGPMVAGLTFVGSGFITETLPYAAINVAVYSDQASAVDGLRVYFSTDGTNWDHVDSYTIPAATGKTFSFQPVAQYMKIEYTNGGVDQTYFRLQTTLKKTYIKPSSHRIQDSISTDDDAELVKSVITGKNPSGTFVNFEATTAGNFKMSVEEFEPDAILDQDYMLAVARGRISGVSIMSKFGQNDDIDTVAYEDIWDGGGTYTYPAWTTAPITHIYSTAAETQSIEVQGLDVDGTLTVQTKTLTGTTVVALDTALWRVFRLKNMSATNNAGVVHASDSGKAVSYAQMQIGNNQTLMALYTIPLGKVGYMYLGTNSLIGTNRTYAISGKMLMRPHQGVFQLKKTFGLQSDGTSYMAMPWPLRGKIAALTDIRVQAISSAAAGGLNTTFEILLIDD